MDVQFDGKAIVEAMMLNEFAKQEEGEKAVKIFRIFKKYGLSVPDALALTMEVAAVLGEEEEGKDS